MSEMLPWAVDVFGANPKTNSLVSNGLLHLLGFVLRLCHHQRQRHCDYIVFNCDYVTETMCFISGAEFKNDCPVEPFIPIYLIVGGAFAMLKTVTILCQRAVTGERLDDEPEEEQSMVAKLFDGVFNLFLFIWFIAGNFWIYSKYKPNFTPPKHQPLNYCHPTLYLFAFWVITTSHIILGIIFFCVCCLGMCASCTAFFVANATG